MRDLVLIGASGLAREVLAADMPTHRVIGILDDNESLHGSAMDGTPVLGGIALAAQLDARLAVCVGSGVTRRLIVRTLRASGVGVERYAELCDASVRIPPGCVVGAGSILLANTVLTANVTVGRHVVVMPNVTLTHDNVLADFATLAASVTLGGSVHVGEAAYLGMNCSVRQGVRIGSEATLGMGAALLRNVPDAEIWVGTPARRLRPAPVVLAGSRENGRRHVEPRSARS